MVCTSVGTLSEVAAPKKQDPNDPKSSPREAIIAATIRAIEAGGEASVRVTEVAHEAGVTQGMVSYYFRDREGLISEANIARFSEAGIQDIKFLVDAARNTQTREEFINILNLSTRAVVSEERAANRRIRTSVIGSIANRPDLQANVAQVLDQLISGTEEIVHIAVERGFVRTSLQPRAIAELVIAYTQGLIIADLDPKCPPREEIARVIDRFIGSLFE